MSKRTRFAKAHGSKFSAARERAEFRYYEWRINIFHKSMNVLKSYERRYKCFKARENEGIQNPFFRRRIRVNADSGYRLRMYREALSARDFASRNYEMSNKER